MKLGDLLTSYEYNEWANACFFGVLDTLDASQIEEPVESSFPSLLATVGHIVAAEWVWLQRWQGHNPTDFPEWLHHPTLSDLRSRLSSVERERTEYLHSLTEESLESPLEYRTLGGQSFTNRLLDLLLHVVNHSTYHRGQLTTLLRQVGATPVATDYVLFRRVQAAPSS